MLGGGFAVRATQERVASSRERCRWVTFSDLRISGARRRPWLSLLRLGLLPSRIPTLLLSACYHLYCNEWWPRVLSRLEGRYRLSACRRGVFTEIWLAGLSLFHFDRNTPYKLILYILTSCPPPLVAEGRQAAGEGVRMVMEIFFRPLRDQAPIPCYYTPVGDV